MVRIVDLVEDFEQSQTKSKCKLVLSGETSVREALLKMQEKNCDCIGVGTKEHDHPAVLSRENLLKGLLSELDSAQQKLKELQQQLEGSIADQLDLVHETVRSLAERENDKLKVAIENMSDGLVILDSNGRIERANSSAKRIFGIGANDNLKTLSAALDELGFRELLASNDGSTKSNCGEFRVKAEGDKVLLLRWTEIIDQQEGFVGNVVMIRDVTEEMSAEKAKTEFIAAISHELRTPLTCIQGSISNMLAGVAGGLTKKTKKYLHTMEGDCHRFANLINDLLDLVKLEAGSMPIDRRVMNIVTVISDAEKSFLREAGVKTIELLVETDGCISPVYADSQRIYQVLRHLISNAMEYTGKSGKVWVRSYDSGDNVIVEVEDTGVGIAPSLQKQIFNKFYQIDRQAGAGYKGSGLGLAICNGIIAAHGGSIWVESEVGKGSTFCFSLPKTNPSVVLNKHLSVLARLTDENKGKFAVLVVKFNVPFQKRDQFKDLIGSAINELLIDSSHFMTDLEDLTVQMNEFETVFVVRYSQQQCLDTVKHKIQKIVSKRIKKYCGETLITPMLGIAVYPDDSKEICNIEEAAWHRAGKMF